MGAGELQLVQAEATSYSLFKRTATGSFIRIKIVTGSEARKEGCVSGGGDEFEGCGVKMIDQLVRIYEADSW